MTSYLPPLPFDQTTLRYTVTVEVVLPNHLSLALRKVAGARNIRDVVSKAIHARLSSLQECTTQLIPKERFEWLGQLFDLVRENPPIVRVTSNEPECHGYPWVPRDVKRLRETRRGRVRK